MLRYVTAQSGRSTRRRSALGPGLVSCVRVTIHTTTKMCKSLKLKLNKYKVHPFACEAPRVAYLERDDTDHECDHDTPNF